MELRVYRWAAATLLALGVACSSSPAGVGGSSDGGSNPQQDGSKSSRDAGKVDATADAARPCGGDGGKACPGTGCTTDSDCMSGSCSAGVCRAASCSDAKKDGTETDVDCGGSCPSCDIGESCHVGSDCSTGVCAAGPSGGTTGPLFCQAPAADDGVQNDSETDVDCGGSLLGDGTANPMSDGAPACGHGQDCLLGSDCASGACNDNGDQGGPPFDCPASATGMCTCQLPSNDDGAHNGGETDIDCGGATLPGSDGAPACGAGSHCDLGSDCQSLICANDVCEAASCHDGVQNDTESDVDCGGGMCPGCPVGKSCMAAADCMSMGCNYANVCVTAPSCVAHNGGDTCGPGESDQGVTTNEDCCLGSPVTASHGTVILDKYKVTSGRMRTFMTAVNGNVRGFIQSQRPLGFMAGATMEPGWDLFLPTAMDGCDVLGNCAADEISDYFVQALSLAADAPFQGIYTSAYRWLGSSLFHGQDLPEQGCNITAPGTHTYWMSDAVQSDYFGDLPADQPQSLYDTRILNCVPYLIAQSFCIWDGGRLEFQDEYTAATGVALVESAGPMPWGSPIPFGGQGTAVGAQFKFPTATDASLQAAYPGNPNTPTAGTSIQWANWFYSYEYPDLGPNNDYVVFISAPGRMLGRGPAGHADLIGPTMEITSDVNTDTGDPRSTLTRWSANGSFEGHPWGFYAWNFSLMNRYGKQGLRCARPVPH